MTWGVTQRGNKVCTRALRSSSGEEGGVGGGSGECEASLNWV